jgi:hypothetical protein
MAIVTVSALIVAPSKTRLRVQVARLMVEAMARGVLTTDPRMLSAVARDLRRAEDEMCDEIRTMVA